MAAPATPNNFIVQTANAQVFVSSDISAGATSYTFQRSTDGVAFTTLGTANVPQYLDTSASPGVQYWYNMAAVNGSGTSPYTAPETAIPVPTGEACLGQLRLMSQQRADRVNSEFVTTAEWNSYINLAYFELYDLLITNYEDYFVAPFASFSCDGSTFLYPLPNGVLSFNNNSGTPFVAQSFYKLLGVDLALNNAQNGYVTINRFNLIDRNRFVYPNTASTIYGVFNLQYRPMGNNIEFIPTPSSGQVIRLLYIPRLTQLLQDTDTTITGISGWFQYIIVRAAKYALDKEESDTSKLDSELLFLKKRIEETAMNRDAGQADRISDTRQGGYNDGFGGFGRNGGIGGW